jgi:hypothetical protein
MARTKKPDIDPHVVLETLRTALHEAGIVFPSLRVDGASPQLKLIELGRIRADVADRLATALRRGDREG